VRCPIVLAHADGTAELFIAEEKVTPELRAHLGNAVTIARASAFVPGLQALAGKRVAVDPERAVQAVFGALEGAGAEVVELTDPCVLAKAIKNPVEQAGHRAAQARDGAAIAASSLAEVEAPKGGVSELAAAAKLRRSARKPAAARSVVRHDLRRRAQCRDPHYRVSEETNRPSPRQVYLVDSGGQYLDGTTDITRTVWIGAGSSRPAEHKDRFTRVLKGHIALARRCSPRAPLAASSTCWRAMPVARAGSITPTAPATASAAFLSVHEGPQRIAKAQGGQAGTEQELLPGMILSNEPGYYKAGEFGIRIENLLLVERREIAGAEGEYLGFETLTWAPIDQTLVDTALLTKAELQWWDDYHARVWGILAPQLEGAALEWLEAACKPLSRG
jgi:Xaa-Pro aminopeptidase